jgi:poly(hydroxyalkanoate) depolymerase family esterase
MSGHNLVRGKRPRLRVTAVLSALVIACALMAFTSTKPAAAAAGLTQVTNFGSNPGSLNMYSYIPTGLPSGAPLVLALHGCSQSATDYYDNSGWPKIADEFGFAVVFAEQPSTSNPIINCFDWGTPSDDSRGNGEAESLYQMVQYAEANYGVNTKRIYITGLSAGAGMTSDMLADYPDVFAGGSIDSGPPAQCSTSGIYNTNCTSGTTSNTPQQWGNLARGSDSGYNGPWPRVAIWQGSSDTTVNPAALTENMDQWTNVWGISQTASSTQSLTGGTTENIYDDSSGNPAVVTFSVSGMTHGLAVNPGSANNQCGTTGTYYLNYICSSYYTALFWGLNSSSSSLPAPTGLTVTGTTSSSVSLSWTAVSGAASYDVYRNGTQVGSPAGTTFTDTGLAASTQYSYTVAAASSSGTAGSQSSAVTATTSAPPQCFTASNYQQTVAGRAYMSGGYVYANGSNQAMGLDNTYTTHTLEETGSNYYVIADSGCP